jgi:hypothetical protein
MTDSRVFHLNEYFISAHLVKTNRRELEGCFWLRHDESLSLDICE